MTEAVRANLTRYSVLVFVVVLLLERHKAFAPELARF
jgi:hypothetical protein